MTMKRDLRLFIDDILESIDLIGKYTENYPEEDFNKDQKLQDSIIRRLEIIGESVKNIPDSFRNKYPEIPWKKIAGLRDIIIHGYFGIVLKRVWEIAKKDIPNLKEKMLMVSDDLEKKAKTKEKV